MYAPVVMFVYKRYEHTKKALEALGNNTLASDSVLYIFSDGAKAEKDLADVEKVRSLVTDFSKTNAFKEVHLRFSEKNNGLATSVINGVSEIIDQYGRVIVLEDDLVTTTDFLEYMNKALEFYEDNAKVWSISGYSFFDPDTLNYPHDIYMGYRGCSWGWATWKDRWEKTDWEVSDYKHFKYNPFLRRKFTISGNDMPGMLDSQMKGFISSWAIRWCYQQNKLKMYTVFPKYSKVKNIGTDGSGTHSGNVHTFDVALEEKRACVFEHLDADKEILKKYQKKFHYSWLSRMKLYIKHVLLGIK